MRIAAGHSSFGQIEDWNSKAHRLPTRCLREAEALTELPARRRAAMALVYDEDMSGAEAARVLGLSAKAVERLLARARAYLRERLLPNHQWEEL